MYQWIVYKTPQSYYYSANFRTINSASSLLRYASLKFPGYMSLFMGKESIKFNMIQNLKFTFIKIYLLIT